MSAGHIIFILIGALVAAFGIWRYLPKSLLYFRPSGIIGTFYENANLDPAPAERAQEEVDRITALGFARAGVQLEKPPLWHKPLEVLILAGNEGRELACVISGKRHVTWYFETIFEGGQIVITSAGGFKPTNEGGLYQSVLDAEALPGEVLARHRDNVAHFVSEGFVPVKRYTPDVIGDMTRLYYGFPVVRRGMRTYGSMNTVPLFILCVPLILALVRW
jgi:hypothetical protein